MRGNDAESINRFFPGSFAPGRFFWFCGQTGRGPEEPAPDLPPSRGGRLPGGVPWPRFPRSGAGVRSWQGEHVSISGRFLGASAPLGDHSPRGARRRAGMGGGAAVGGGRRTGGRDRPEAGPGRRDLLRCWGGEAADRSSLRGSLAANGPIVAGAVASLTAAEAIFQPGSVAHKRASDLGASLDSALFCGFSKGPCTDSRHEIC